MRSFKIYNVLEGINFSPFLNNSFVIPEVPAILGSIVIISTILSINYDYSQRSSEKCFPGSQ